MENVGVMMTTPMSSYLEQQLQQRFTLFKLWESPSLTHFLTRRADSVRAVVGDTKMGADSKLIDSLPLLEIVSTYSVGLDKIDLDKCREREIRVTNTPDVLTDDVADLAIGLALATLRKICACDAFVRRGSWRNGDFQLATKVCDFLFFVSFQYYGALPPSFWECINYYLNSYICFYVAESSPRSCGSTLFFYASRIWAVVL